MIRFFLLLLLAPALLPASPVEKVLVPHLDFPREVHRGDFLPVTILLRDPVQRVRGRLTSGSGGRLLEVPAFPMGGRPPQAWVLLLGLPNWLEEGSYRLEVYGFNGPAEALGSAEDGYTVGHLDIPEDRMAFLYRGEVHVLHRDFPVQRVALNRRLTQLRSEETPQKQEQTRSLTDILYTVQPKAVYHPGRLILPLPDTRRTAAYADRRVYAYSDGSTSTTIHNGIDFAAPEGTPVVASGSGYVVVARDRVLTGYTVVIEHLPGVYSLYYHLSGLDVEEDTMVQAGQLIGRVGSTGLATGAHLHWEIRVGGVAVDPEALTRSRIIDKRAIFGMMEQVFGP